MDIAPTEKLLGGETRILEKLRELTATFGLITKMVACDRPEWARALSVLTTSENIVPPGKSQARLLDLAIDHLVHCGDPMAIEEELKERGQLVAFMKRVGLQKISDFTRLNATAVGRRFGRLGIRLKQWVMGERELHLPLFVPSENLLEKLDTDDIYTLDSLFEGLKEVFTKMEARLLGRQQSARGLKFTFHLESGSLIKWLKFSEPLRDAPRMEKLSREFLRNVTWDTPLQRLELEMTELEAFISGQLSLFNKVENKFSDLNLYVQRVQSRLGTESAGFADLKESYLPERSWEIVADNQKIKEPSPSARIFPWMRPPILYHPPRPFSPRKDFKLIPSENLTAEWWSEGGHHRKYFIARSSQGEKLWVFWDNDRHTWFLHGTFD